MRSQMEPVDEIEELEPVFNLGGYRREQTSINPYGLTDVQVQTIQMLTNGYTQRQVAEMGNVTLGCVKERLGWIRLRMQVDTTMQAVVQWVREVEFGDADAA